MNAVAEIPWWTWSIVAAAGANSQNAALTMMNTPVLNPAASDCDGLFGLQNSIAATNLGFWGIEKGVDSVSFAIAWPESAFFTDNRLDLYGNWRLATNDYNGNYEDDSHL